jgi:glyoxylase-like metal-dependent hydrolase (beta-lactamase superfamily II)
MKATSTTIRLFFSFLLLTFIHTAVIAKESKGIMDDYEAKQVAVHTWVVFGPTTEPNVENQGFMNNPAFVITEKSVAVIDPGSSVNTGRALLKKIKDLTDRPVTHVFNSHIHGDHWLGNQAFKEANPDVKIYAHPQMIEEAKAGEADNWIKLMMTLTEGATKDTKVVYPTNVLKNGQEVVIDDISIKAHLSEFAHTKTDAMFEVVQDKLLITGDNSFSQRMPRLDDGSFVGNIKAMETGLALDLKVVIPGHGPAGGKEVLSDFREFLATIYNTSKELIDEDMEPFEMKPIIVKKLEKYSTWVNFDKNIGKLISLAVIEAENE